MDPAAKSSAAGLLERSDGKGPSLALPRERMDVRGPSPRLNASVKILLVIPCLRERARLPLFLPALLTSLAAAAAPVEVLVVDDGSGEEEKAWLREYVSGLQEAYAGLLPPLLLPENAGKGGAVYAGWASAGAEHTHVGFVDADGAIPPEETARLCVLAIRTPKRAIFAVRTGEDETMVQRHPGRGVAGQFSGDW